MVTAIVASVSFTSCQKDYNALLLGKWTVTKAKSEATVAGINVPKDLTKAYKAFEFQENGTCLMTTTEMNPMTGVVTPNSDTIRHYQWELVNGKTIHITTPNDYEINYDISYLDETKLTFHGETFDTVPGFPELGKVQMAMTMNLTK